MQQSTPPRALIITIYGLYARELGGWLSVATLIRLMGALGVDEPAVRSSISRLKRRGMLVPERVGGAAGYGLSNSAREILAEGDRRIFKRPQGRLEDGWVLVIFSVPETQRARRHTLRSRLAWLGFGNVAPGVWIAPVHLVEEATSVLAQDGLSHYVDIFTGQHLAAAELREHVSRWWDFEQIQDSYAAYVQRWRPVLDNWSSGGGSDEDAFAHYMHTLTEWRRLPYLDPGLPAELVPDGWQGNEAADIFFGLRERLADAAHEFVDRTR